MKAGALRHRVAVERLETIPDGGGGTTTEWVTLFEAWAQVETLRGREYWAAQQVQSEADFRLTMRYRDDMALDDRIVFDGMTLNPDHIGDPDGRRERLEVLATTV